MPAFWLTWYRFDSVFSGLQWLVDLCYFYRYVPGLLLHCSSKFMDVQGHSRKGLPKWRLTLHRTLYFYEIKNGCQCNLQIRCMYRWTWVRDPEPARNNARTPILYPFHNMQNKLFRKMTNLDVSTMTSQSQVNMTIQMNTMATQRTFLRMRVNVSDLRNRFEIYGSEPEHAAISSSTRTLLSKYDHVDIKGIQIKFVHQDMYFSYWYVKKNDSGW